MCKETEKRNAYSGEKFRQYKMSLHGKGCCNYQTKFQNKVLMKDQIKNEGNNQQICNRKINRNSPIHTIEI